MGQVRHGSATIEPVRRHRLHPAGEDTAFGNQGIEMAHRYRQEVLGKPVKRRAA